MTIWNLGAAPANAANSRHQPAASPRSGPGKQYATVQAALEAATADHDHAGTGSSSSGRAPRPRSTRAVSTTRTSSSTTGCAIQGVGPGGFTPRRTAPAVGARLDHRRLRASTPTTPGGTAWINLLGGAAATPASPTCRTPRSITVLDDPRHRASDAAYPVAIDGLQVTGGAQSGLPGNVNVAHRRHQDAVRRRPVPSSPRAAASTSTTTYRSTAGSPTTSSSATAAPTAAASGSARPTRGDNRNYDTVIARQPGPATTAGPTSPAASGSSPAATATRSPHNAICGNFSAEYGGAMTAFGYQATAAAATAARSRGNTDLVQQLLRRGRRGHGRRRAAGRPDRALSQGTGR